MAPTDCKRPAMTSAATISGPRIGASGQPTRAAPDRAPAFLRERLQP